MSVACRVLLLQLFSHQVCAKPGWHASLRGSWIRTQGRSCPALVCGSEHYRILNCLKQTNYRLRRVDHFLPQVQSHQVLRHRNEAVPQGQLRVFPWWRSCSCRSWWRRWCRPLWIQVCGPEERWVINFTLVFSDEEESEEKKRITEERLKAYHEKKSKKAAVIAKTSVLLDVKVASNNITLDLLFKHIIVRSLGTMRLTWTRCSRAWRASSRTVSCGEPASWSPSVMASRSCRCAMHLDYHYPFRH